MYLWQKGDLGEYLTKSEQELSKKLQKDFEDFCDEKMIKQEHRGSAKTMVAYLNHQNGESHEPAYFSGGLSERMKLAYSDKAYVKMISRQSPISKAEWNKAFPNLPYPERGKMARETNKPGTGQSLVLAMPKSLSMAYSMKNREGQQQIRNAIKAADREIEKETARLIRPSSANYVMDWEVRQNPEAYKDKDPKFIIDTSKTEIFFANFTHYESRGVEPHLHLHKQLGPVANFTTMDGQQHLLVLDPKECYERQKELTSQFNTLLVNELDQIGIRTIDDRQYDNQHAYRVAGITREQEIALSSRRSEIEAAIRKDNNLDEKAVINDALLAEYIAKNELQRSTREAKIEMSAAEIHEVIQRKTVGVLDFQGLKEYEQAQQGKIKYEKPAFDITQMREFQLSGVASESVIKAEIGNQLRFSPDRPKTLEDIKKRVDAEYASLLSNDRLVKMEDGSLTTLEFIKTEKEVGRHIERLLEKTNTTIDPKFKAHFEAWEAKQPHALNAGQQTAALAGTYDNDLLIINAAAGAGKTSTSINYLNSLWTSEEYAAEYGEVKVIGISTQDLTTNALADAGINDRKNTLAFTSQFYDYETGQWKQEAIDKLSKGHLRIVMDEASMTNSKTYEVILGLQEKIEAGGGTCKLALVGDTQQLASVGSGNSFSYAVKEALKVRDTEGHCVNYATMDETVRHKLDSTRQIAESFQQREPEKALEILKEQGWWTEIKGEGEREDKMAKLAETLATDFVNSERKDKIAIAFSNKDVDLLNEAIRTKLLEQDHSPIDKDSQRLISVYEKGAIRSSQNQKELLFGIGEEILMTSKCPLVQYNEKTQKYDYIKDENGKRVSLENGTTAKIVNIEDHQKIRGQQNYKITIEKDGKNYTLFTGCNENRVFNRAYCRTSYSAQGATVDETFLYCSSATNANASYVNFSRSRYEVKGYILEGDEKKWLENAASDMTKATTIDSELCQEAYKRAITTPTLTKQPEPKANPVSRVEAKIDEMAELLEKSGDKALEIEDRVKDSQIKVLTREQVSQRVWQAESKEERAYWSQIEGEMIRENLVKKGIKFNKQGKVISTRQTMDAKGKMITITEEIDIGDIE